MQPEKLPENPARPAPPRRSALARWVYLAGVFCRALAVARRETAAKTVPKKIRFDQPVPWKVAWLWWLFFVAVVIGGVSYPVPFPVIIMLMVPMVLFTGATCLIRAFSCAARDNWRGVLYAILAFGLVVGTVKLNFYLRSEQEKASLVVGDQIIAAIARFEEKNGTRPKTLDQLVPVYLPAVPRTKMQIRLSEFVYHGQSLGFKFADWKGSMWRYNSRERLWERDTH